MAVLARLLITAFPGDVSCFSTVPAAGLLRALGADMAWLAAVVAGLLVGAVTSDVACRIGNIDEDREEGGKIRS